MLVALLRPQADHKQRLDTEVQCIVVAHADEFGRLEGHPASAYIVDTAREAPAWKQRLTGDNRLNFDDILAEWSNHKGGQEPSSDGDQLANDDLVPETDRLDGLRLQHEQYKSPALEVGKLDEPNPQLGRSGFFDEETRTLQEYVALIHELQDECRAELDTLPRSTPKNRKRAQSTMWQLKMLEKKRRKALLDYRIAKFAKLKKLQEQKKLRPQAGGPPKILDEIEALAKPDLTPPAGVSESQKLASDDEEDLDGPPNSLLLSSHDLE